MKRANEIIAETFGWDIKEVSDCRYQKYQAPAVYSIGDKYFAVSKTKPKHGDVGGEWTEYSDQFFSGRENTKMWVCNAE